ncbi:MAG: hypothetical protein KDA31_10255 [Phycisphaerales bacterium]|nr:hypothetical protein [Phycisphaerales bacterium]
MDEDRANKIEEAQLFAEKRSDDHDEAIRELGERVLQLIKRIDRLEEKFDRVLTAADPGSDEPEVPPHSGRLPGGR